MSTVDLSRNATDLRKRYEGVRMQQGRVLTDDDFNDAANLASEEMRRTRLDAIGAFGSSDAGFLVKDLQLASDLGIGAPGRPSFRLSAGTIYLGGLRVVMPADEWFHLQKDWLNFDAALHWPEGPADGETRIDLVWMEVWQQPVTAVEDGELFETALGGPDTSVRWRTLRRVNVMPGVGTSDCPEAWEAAQESFAGLGAIAPDMELATQAKLQVTFTAPITPADLCSPPTPGGYLGAENQAIRVQLVSDTEYTWGYNNAAPLYRVQIESRDGDRVVVRMLNLPRDAVHWPLQGQVAEILPWSAALDNGETVAELSGHFSKVAVSYNPDEETFELEVEVPPGFGEQWKVRSDQDGFFDGTPADEYFFLRMWNRGDDLESPALIPIDEGDLGNTGLHVEFVDGPLRANDFWIIAARPSTPDVITPWLLEAAGGAPIHGVRRYRAPLGLIEWRNEDGDLTGTLIHDCRPPFLPLTKIRGCCSVSVGDGTHSFGQFTSINAAIASLPSTGGTVCVLPGVYEESVVIANRSNITVHGCGPRSRILAQSVDGVAQPAVMMTNSTDITLESLGLTGGPAAVVHVEDDCVFIRLSDNLVQMRDDSEEASPWPAVFTRADDVVIERNVVEIVPDDPLPRVDRLELADAARGGIQIGGGSERVRVIGNRITGGIGNGITLGSLLRNEPGVPGTEVPDIDIIDPCAPCAPVDGTIPPPIEPGDPTYESAGDLYDIELLDNEIRRQGANGISVVRFFILSEDSADVIAVHGLTIRDNRIIANLRREVATTDDPLRMFVGYGGICLALCSELVIEDNDILENGIDWRTPVCGIFVLRAEGLHIEHNRIENNGRRGSGPVSGTQPGLRAGIHIWMAQAGIRPLIDPDGVFSRLRGTGSEQIRIHANHVIQPLGRALFMIGEGPMLITDNRLVSQGVGRPATDLFADSVLVFNFGLSREWTLGLLLVFILLIFLIIIGDIDDSYQQLLCLLVRFAILFPPLSLPTQPGKIAFNDNQVALHMDEREAAFTVAVSSVLLLSLDDVMANDNQIEHHHPRRLVLADLLALGFSVRTNDNRLAETWGRALLSLLSFGFMNTAADNQSTHCIRVFGFQEAEHHNLVLSEAFCEAACSNRGGLLGRLATGAMAATIGPQP
jgi:hypothetical protein